MDVDRIKKTPLGRAWLSVFVRRVWESLDGRQRESFLWFVHEIDDDLVAFPFLEAHGLARLGVLSLLRHQEFPGVYPLTPLGVEVYLYGRREARNRGGR